MPLAAIQLMILSIKPFFTQWNKSRRRGARRLQRKNFNVTLEPSKSRSSSHAKEYLLIATLAIITLISAGWLLINFTDIDKYLKPNQSVAKVQSIAEEKVSGNDNPVASENSVEENSEANTLQSENDINASVNLPTRLFTRTEVAANLNFPAGLNEYPETVRFNTPQYQGLMKVDYTINHRLQEKITDWLIQYNSDYAAVAVIDIDTGKIQAISSHVADGAPRHNLAVNAYYPGASIFKIVTAAAALDAGLLSPNSTIPFNGSSTSLYKKQVFEHSNTKWTRKPTLTESFAKSINPVFGRIGANVLGYDRMKQYGRSFGFNRRFNTDIEISPSRLNIAQDDPWSLVEAGSGYTQDTLLSPLHGALLAASVANGGMLKLPYWVNSVVDEDGELWYKGEAVDIEQIIKPSTAQSMKELMEATVTSGTARKSFANYIRQKADKNGLEIGGKTGTLRGRGPNNEIKGLHDWFVGYAMMGDQRIAFGILNVSKDKWKIKSHVLAKMLVDYYFFDMPLLIEEEKAKSELEEAPVEDITTASISEAKVNQAITKKVP